MLNFLLIIGGFALLIYGANILVDGSASLAKRFKVSPLVIGLTVVAFGTSAPELVVNLIAVLNGNTALAIGNILGSNIANVLLIGGTAAIIYPLTVHRRTVWLEIPLSLLGAFLIMVMGNDLWFDGIMINPGEPGMITRSDGLVLLAFFIIFMVYIFHSAKDSLADDSEIPDLSTARITFYIIGGLIGLVLGGKWVVDGAVTISRDIGIDEKLVGLSVVAVGTSLPELVTSVVAAFKKRTDLAVGNIVGSNIFNIFFVLGLSSVVQFLPFSSTTIYDSGVNVLSSLMLFLFLFWDKQKRISRFEGAMLLLAYFGYMSYILSRV